MKDRQADPQVSDALAADEAVGDAGAFRASTLRQSLGLVDRLNTNKDVLEYFLALESSRQELEIYARRLDGVVLQAAKAKSEAEAVARTKSDFLATMSHEMRTPLNGILGMAAVLLSRNLGERERDYVETIRQAGESLRSVVDDVLDFSKIEAGQLRLERLDFELGKVVQEALRIVQPVASQKALKLVTNLDPGLPRYVRGDITRVRQILLNLLSNAIKFTAVGAIEVKARLQSFDGQEFEILFSVKDEGIGITEEQQTHLFRPFSQAEDSTSRKFGGTGLGLAICRRLAELMGGEIGVSSRFGEGSVFWFTVRMLVSQGEIPVDEPEMNLPPLVRFEMKNARLLLVEDNKINQKVAQLMLKNIGYQADLAQNGSEALKAILEKQYDLILMDCMMPEMDGFEATRRLRAMEGFSGQVPVIAMTASAFDDDRLACMNAGMNDFLSKPVREEDLAAKLSFWLSPQRRPAVHS